MTITLPSKRVAVVDAPEAENFSAKFVYNFFTADEELNDSGTTPPDFIEKRPAGEFEQSFLDSRNFNRFTPRYVRFEWKANPAGNRPELGRTISVGTNLAKIHSEETFIDSNYTNVFFQDEQRKDKLAFFIRRAIEEARQDQLGLAPGERAPSAEESPLDLVRYLYRNTTDQVRGDFLADYFIELRKNGFRFLDSKNTEAIATTATARAKGVRTRTQLNNKVLASFLKTAKQNPINIYDNETARLLPQAEQIQQRAIAQSSSDTLSANDYDFEIVDVIDYRMVDPAAFDSTVQVVGYVIEKTEYTPNGPVKREPIVVESTHASSTADLKVKYGATYGYTIKTIVYVEVAAHDQDTNQVIAVSFLVSSRRSEEVVVNCIEEVPPPTVADFNIEWDFLKDAPKISWSFPVNPQRDIKYFQVFRRDSINQPFELLSMYDFNDSLTPHRLNETVDPILMHKMQSPRGFYMDYEFKKESKAIYAVATVDAHGFTSNYSMQLEISFDRFKNKLNKKLISVGGAPKPYPNFFLQQDAFVDSIRSSGAKAAKVIFNPEFLRITNNDNADLGFLKMQNGQGYKLQMINVDLQAQQTFDVVLEDRRIKKI